MRICTSDSYLYTRSTMSGVLHLPCLPTSSRNLSLPFSTNLAVPSRTLTQSSRRVVGGRLVSYSAGDTNATSGVAPQPEEEDIQPPEALQVPVAWACPDVAAQESEWLRGALHQWLDDEYCPEPANVEISKRCASVFYYCLLEKQLDIGDILMQMVNNLETFSFKESFHGAFSSANAAVDLITKRMNQVS